MAFLGSLFSGGNKQTSAEQKQIQDLFTQLTGRSDQQAKAGKQDRKQFRNALDPVSAWLQKIVGGDRTEIMAAEGPEITAKNEQYDAVSKAISQFAPRGGGRSAALSNVEFAKARDIGDLFAKARPMAAQGLEQVASIYGAQASSESATGMSGLTSVLAGALGLRQQDIQQAMATRAGAQQLGQSLGMILGQLLNRRGSSSSTSSGFGSLAGLGGTPDPSANPYGEAGGN